VSRAWTECDRSEKLASFSALPKLILAVTKAVEAQINATTQTSNTVSALMSALGIVNDSSDEGTAGDSSDQPRLTIIMKPEEALAAQVASRPTTRSRPVIKVNPSTSSADLRRNGRKEEVKAG
jgi:uncharacterized membrane protein